MLFYFKQIFEQHQIPCNLIKKFASSLLLPFFLFLLPSSSIFSFASAIVRTRFARTGCCDSILWHNTIAFQFDFTFCCVVLVLPLKSCIYTVPKCFKRRLFYGTFPFSNNWNVRKALQNKKKEKRKMKTLHSWMMRMKVDCKKCVIFGKRWPRNLLFRSVLFCWCGKFFCHEWFLCVCEPNLCLGFQMRQTFFFNTINVNAMVFFSSLSSAFTRFSSNARK